MQILDLDNREWHEGGKLPHEVCRNSDVDEM